MAGPETIALITGANKGIGLETARQLAQRGVSVLIGARDEARGRKAAESLVEQGAKARWIALDVTAQASIDAAAAEIGEAFGKLDILVNNAGVGLENTPPSQFPIESLRATLETNFFGAFAAAQTFLPLIRKSPAGRIVNVSSTLGSLFHLSDPEWIGAGSTFVAYSISKAALNMMTVQFATELRGTPIKVNSVEPGYTATDMTAHQGYQTVESAAQVIVKYATIGPDGPTGGYFQATGRLPW